MLPTNRKALGSTSARCGRILVRAGSCRSRVSFRRPFRSPRWRHRTREPPVLADLDPGNLESDLQAGAYGGYQLIWVASPLPVLRGLLYTSLSPPTAASSTHTSNDQIWIKQVLFWATVVGLLLQILAVRFSFEPIPRPRLPARASFTPRADTARRKRRVCERAACRFGWAWSPG